MGYAHGRGGFNGLNVEYNGLLSIPINSKAEKTRVA